MNLLYILSVIMVIGMGKSWYGPFSFLLILFKFNIAISVFNGPFFCGMSVCAKYFLID